MEKTEPTLMGLPKELRNMIFSSCMADEEIVVTATAKDKPALFRVSKQIRAKAQYSFEQEAELVILVGSNFADRAMKRQYPEHEFDVDHAY